MKTHTLVIGLLSCIGPLAGAQEPICVIDGRRMPPDQCGFQEAIGLTDRQRGSVRDAIKEAQGKFVDIQFQMSAEVEKLQRLLQGSTVQEASVLQQVDRVLGLEREMKHAQLTLLIRIKNALTEEQQAALTRLRRQGPGDRPAPLDTKRPSTQ
jgi:Spy/CpxP family protein refolding chaperone